MAFRKTLFWGGVHTLSCMFKGFLCSNTPSLNEWMIIKLTEWNSITGSGVLDQRSMTVAFEDQNCPAIDPCGAALTFLKLQLFCSLNYFFTVILLSSFKLLCIYLSKKLALILKLYYMYFYLSNKCMYIWLTILQLKLFYNTYYTYTKYFCTSAFFLEQYCVIFLCAVILFYIVIICLKSFSCVLS